MNRAQIQLSKTLSYALRHAPWEYELELDDAGWVSVAAILDALHNERIEWRGLTESDLALIVSSGDKCRFELANGYIRALYGHSVPQRLIKEPAPPPVVLYHGTTTTRVNAILENGLIPMARHYVHLSVDEGTALQVATRHHGRAVIFTVRAADAYDAGIPFYRGNEHVWLADSVPPAYLSTPFVAS